MRVPLSLEQRKLLLSTFVFSVARGIFGAVAVIYLTTVLDLTGVQVGVALSLAGVVGIVLSVPVGHLADRHGPRLLAVLGALAQAALTLALLASGSWPVVLVPVGLLGAVERANTVVRQALVSHIAGTEARVRTQAYIRTVFNVGLAAGALLASPALVMDNRMGYLVSIVAATLVYVLAAKLTARLSTQPRLLPKRTGSVGDGQRHDESARARPNPLRDMPYLSVAFANGVIALHISILEVGLPLWIVRNGDAPKWVLALLIATNTVLAVLLQVWASRSASTTLTAARSLAGAGILIFMACAAFAVTNGLSGTALVVGLFAAVVLLTFGELLQGAGEWGVSFGLAPHHAQGGYLGAFSFGHSVQQAAGPPLVGAVAIGYAPAGWIVLGIFIALSGGLLIILTRWSERVGAARARWPWEEPSRPTATTS